MALNNSYTVGGNTDETIIYKGKVESISNNIYEPNGDIGYSPIKVRLEVPDSTIIETKDLPDCYPLLPKHLNVYPKVGEYVYVITLAKGSTQQLRYFLGPVIDSFGSLNFNEFDNTETNSNIKPNLRKPEDGIYPKREWISIQGRNNSDIVFKDQEVLLRAGKFNSGDPYTFNIKDTAYIQMRYGQPETIETNELQTTREVKLAKYDGFVSVNIISIQNVLYDWVVNIQVQDKDNRPIGKIYKTFTGKENATLFVKETYIKLKQNDLKTKLLITNNFQKQIEVDKYDFKNFKYSAPPIDGLDVVADGLNDKIMTTIKTNIVPVTKTQFDNTKGSAINVVASKINLVSYGNKNQFKLLDPDVTITPEQQLKINSESQPIPYGYALNDFLKLIKSFVETHVHPYHGMPPDPTPVVLQILNFDLETILNQNVRTA
jgi:hypothetical protein